MTRNFHYYYVRCWLGGVLVLVLRADQMNETVCTVESSTDGRPAQHIKHHQLIHMYTGSIWI